MPLTPGNWSVGTKYGGAVVSDCPVQRAVVAAPYAQEAYEAYGGELIAESIGNPADRLLIACSKRLLEASRKAVDEWIAWTARGYVANSALSAALDGLHSIVGTHDAAAALQEKSLPAPADDDIIDADFQIIESSQ